MRALVTNGIAAELPYGGFTSGATQYPANVLDLWSEADLKAIGVYTVTETSIPEGKVSTGWTLVFDGSTVTKVHTLIDKPAPSKTDLKAMAASARYERETRGITMPDGSRVATTRDSQAMITGAFSLAKDDPSAIIQFKTETGFVTLDSATMLAIGRAVAAHVQGCFALEASVCADIDAGTITTQAQIAQAFA